MKYQLKLFGAFLMILCIGCATGKDAGTSDKSASKTITARNLASYISTIPRLSVRNNQVYNVTTSTIKQGTRPLFIIDGIQVGRDFSRVLTLLGEHETLEVEFMKMSRATIRYGESGRNGVILIKKG